jgi:hypothetical protein
MSISKNDEKAAHKILCIGGSTFNLGTVEKIKDALEKTKFLEEWAVIFVNHDYFKISDKQAENKINKDKIQHEWEGSNINFVDQIGNHAININTVYILPDPSKLPGELDFVPKQLDFVPKEDESNLPIIASKDWRYADCIEKNGQVILQVLDPQSSHDKSYDWCEKNLLDGGGNQRNLDTMPYIDKFMRELADVTTKIKGVKIAGLILCGLGGDGAYGLKAIKDKGGNTAVQNPGECSHPKREKTTRSMPDTAIAINKKPKHQKISIEGNSCVISLTEWLESIR